MIGSAGSAEKVEWLRSLGVEAFDYRETPAKDALADGIDVYFDNVGGEQLEAALSALRPFGRVDRVRRDLALQRRAARARPAQPRLRRLEAAAHPGLHRHRPLRRASASSSPRSARGCATGKLQYRETILDGIENVPAAFAGLFRGDNIGQDARPRRSGRVAAAHERDAGRAEQRPPVDREEADVRCRATAGTRDRAVPVRTARRCRARTIDLAVERQLERPFVAFGSSVSSSAPPRQS